MYSGSQYVHGAYPPPLYDQEQIYQPIPIPLEDPQVSSIPSPTLLAWYCLFCFILQMYTDKVVMLILYEQKKWNTVFDLITALCA